MWTDQLPIALSTILGDLSNSPQTFNESRLEYSLVVAGLLVSSEFPPPGIQEYTFDLSVPNFCPDPTIVNDTPFITLTILKAACVISQGQFLNALSNGIAVKDGSSSVQTFGGLPGYSNFLKLGPCASYQEMLNRLRMQRNIKECGAVLSPFGKSFGNSWGNNFTLGNDYIRSYFDQALSWWH